MQFSKYRSALNLLLIVFLIFPFGSGCQAKVSEHISHQEKEGVLYHCPMHPSVISKKPGNCPICGMALVKNEEGTDASPIKVPGHANVVVFPERQQLIGLTSSLVETKPLTLTLHAAGHVAYNPDLSQALAEYVDASQAYWRSKRLGTDVARERGEKLLELAELKLRLAGFDDKQMGLIKIQPSARPPVITDQFIPKNLTLPENAVWVIADIYEPDAELILPGQRAAMTASALPGLKFEGEVKSMDPVLNSMTRVVRARIEVPNAEKLKPRMSLDVHIEVPLGNVLAISVDSVFHTGETTLTFVLEEEGRIEPREITLGREGDGYYEVISGLSEGENVVAQGGFLIDSESRLQAALKSFQPVGEVKNTQAEGETRTHIH
ncbi:MAG: hypothetical protein A3C35_00865 [Omnitrophica bacterium RIFCSPHIGHO2_02_FULL_46_11]|nr:MAG: hypothetical protein A3C35_00865 [Omnitrophica bacterium RIFCSPHIGHO2_02_FULL_46_11]OGW86800.1 MAG: hypothetical protein A3A81_04025 [Omnitrophica bacterium RIFCSPLOWO2_01_FULL_45_10b]